MKMVRLNSSFPKNCKNYKSFTTFGQNTGKSEFGNSKKGGRREAQGVKKPKNRRLKEQKTAGKFASPTLLKRAPRQSQAAKKVGHLGKTQTKKSKENKRCQGAKKPRGQRTKPSFSSEITPEAFNKVRTPDMQPEATTFTRNTLIERSLLKHPTRFGLLACNPRPHTSSETHLSIDHC